MWRLIHLFDHHTRLVDITPHPVDTLLYLVDIPVDSVDIRAHWVDMLPFAVDIATHLVDTPYLRLISKHN